MSFTVKPRTREVPLIFSPTPTSDFLPAVSTVELDNDESSFVHLVQLVSAATFVALDNDRRRRSAGSDVNVVKFVTGEHCLLEDPNVYISIPNGSISLLGGGLPGSLSNVKILFDFVDFTQRSGIASAPGAGLLIDGNGNRRYLWFYAMLGYKLDDPDFYLSGNHSSKLQLLNQCWLNVGLSSFMLNQH